MLKSTQESESDSARLGYIMKFDVWKNPEIFMRLHVFFVLMGDLKTRFVVCKTVFICN